MTSKERMMRALQRERPDRLPVTIHQWQRYHLRQFMNGMDQLEAFRATGLDASITPSVMNLRCSERWELGERDEPGERGETVQRHTARTPDGELTWTTSSNEYTTFVVEHPVKSQRDAEIFLKHWPGNELDHRKLTEWYDRTGDDGIVRGFVQTYAQPGPWQELCELIGTQEAIYWALDEPEFIHHLLGALADQKVRYVHEQMRGASYDLIEHGGGAASSTVISPAMFDEFCAPYDRKIIAALHEEGFPVVYHTCGGMMANLEHIPANGCDASETLSPPGVGGDINPEQRRRVKSVLGSKVALIGGIDQDKLLTRGTPRQIVQDVRHCFETFGAGGGYICSASDHFFHAPVENLRALAQAGAECRYAE